MPKSTQKKASKNQADSDILKGAGFGKSAAAVRLQKVKDAIEKMDDPTFLRLHTELQFAFSWHAHAKIAAHDCILWANDYETAAARGHVAAKEEHSNRSDLIKGSDLYRLIRSDYNRRAGSKVFNGQECSYACFPSNKSFEDFRESLQIVLAAKYSIAERPSGGGSRAKLQKAKKAIKKAGKVEIAGIFIDGDLFEKFNAHFVKKEDLASRSKKQNETS